MLTPSLNKENISFEVKKEFKLNEYKLKISFNDSLMFIEILEENIFPKEEYNLYVNLDKLKNINIYFAQFTSLYEVCESFEELIRIKNLSILKEDKNFKIKITNPILKKKEFYIDIPAKERNIKDEIESIIEYVHSLNDKIKNMEMKYNNKIKALEDKIEKMEKREKINKANEIDLNSIIIQNIDNLEFLNDELENKLNGKIKYNLIYRATRDGPKTSDFNKACNGKNNQLIVLKTTKGVIFGGFTGRGFQNTKNQRIKDNSVFLFSFKNKKIYRIIKDSNAIYEDARNEYGIFFGKCDGDCPIYLGWRNENMLINNSETCSKLNKEYEFTKDYELNEGEQYFNLEEIEVFQIIKK